MNTYNAFRRLGKHFRTVSGSEFMSNVRDFSPEILEGQSGVEPPTPGAVVLLSPSRRPLPLGAYLATALTDLQPGDRALIDEMSEKILRICADFAIDLYQPGKHSDPVMNPDLSGDEVFRLDRDRVLASDLLIHLALYPSTGSGEELDFAYNALLPIILISPGHKRISRMVSGIPALKVEITYQTADDLEIELRERLVELRPVLEQRKLAFSQYDRNIVGDRIRELREELGITREEVAKASTGLTASSLAHIEDSTDRIGNPSLLQLRQIAATLHTTVADLVEPDLSERLFAYLQQEIEPEAARKGEFRPISVNDQRRIVRRVLLRIIDSLEKE